MNDLLGGGGQYIDLGLLTWCVVRNGYIHSLDTLCHCSIDSGARQCGAPAHPSRDVSMGGVRREPSCIRDHHQQINPAARRVSKIGEER